MPELFQQGAIFLVNLRAPIASLFAMFVITFAIVGCSIVNRTPTPIDIILVAGQSNAVGADSDPKLLSADPRDHSILFWWKCGDPPPDSHDSTSKGAWTHLQAQPRGNPLPLDPNNRQWGNFSHNAGGFGPEITLARSLAAAPGARIALVKVAFSGTSFSKDWNPERSTARGLCYSALVDEVQKALTALGGAGYRPRLRALIWIQGESDCTPDDAPLYRSRMQGFINAVRADLGTADLAVLMGFNNLMNGPDDSLVQSVVEAQKAVARENQHCAYVDTRGASLANRYHFDALGNMEVGRRFAAALQKMESWTVHN